MATPQEQRNFIARLMPTAIEWSRRTGIPAETYIAIAASETNWGAAPTIFGIKGKGTAGSQTFDTWEEVNGKRVNIKDSFAVYNTLDDAFEAFTNLISTGRYKPAWDEFQRTGNPGQLITGLQKAGYATDSQWPQKIASIANTVAQVQGTKPPTPPPPGPNPNAMGPAGRTFAQTTGKPYISDEERAWYLAQLNPAGTGPIGPVGPAPGGAQMPPDPVPPPSQFLDESANGEWRWNGNGPNGYGTYIMNANGTVKAFVGDPRSPSTPTANETTVYKADGPQGPGVYRVLLDPQGNETRIIGLATAPQQPPAPNETTVYKADGPQGPGVYRVLLDQQGNETRIIGLATEPRQAPRPEGAVTTDQLKQAGAQMGTPGVAVLNGQRYVQNPDGTWQPSGAPPAAPPKTALQLMAEQFNQTMGTLQGNAGATGGAAPPPTGGSLSTAEGGSAAGPGNAPAGAGVGAIYGVDRAGNTQPTALRIQTPGSGSPTADINATNIYQTLGQWGVKPTGDFAKDAAEAAKLQVQLQMQTQLAGGDPLLASKAIDAMTGGAGGRNGYYPTPQMREMVQSSVSRSPYDGKGVKFDPDELAGFEKAQPRDYDVLYGFQSGGTVGANVDQPPPLNPTMPDLGPQGQAGSVPVQPATNPLPIGAIGKDWEGNPLYGQPRDPRFASSTGGRGGLGPSRGYYAANARNPYASGMNADGTPFQWVGNPLPVRYVSSQEQLFSANRNAQIMGRVRQLEAMGRWPEAQRLRAAMYDPYSMKSPPEVPGFDNGGTITAGTIRDSLMGYAGGGMVGAGMPVTPAPAGAQMMTQEPIMGVGMQTGQPQFVAGEAGPENINIQPVMPPMTDFARLMETMMGTKRANRPRATKPAGSLMMGGGY